MMSSLLHDISAIQGITFHLLRPWWLLAILPALLLGWHLRKRQSQQNNWMSVIDNELLAALLDRHEQQQKKNYAATALLAAWLMAVVGLAGPSFEQIPQAAVKQADALVVLLDLSPSMLGQDVKPSRLQAAHYKVLDLLRERREGYTGLIAYSGSAHVVAPLSDDANTISALVSTLEPGIMPSLGSNTESAVDEALQLLKNSHFDKGRILLITDGVAPEAVAYISKTLQEHPVQLSVISVGTEAGSPIELQDGSFLKDESGKTLINKLDSSTLHELAESNGGYYSHIQSNDSDIAPLLTSTPLANGIHSDTQRDASHTIKHWKDNGYWLVLPCLALTLFFFKRGVLLCILPLLLLTYNDSTYADDTPTGTGWQDWWFTPDQQAKAALDKGDSATAAKKFSDTQWKGYAEYRNGQYKEATEHFGQLDTPVANYNKGNALAQQGDYQEAVNSYQQALKQQPDFPEASFNLDLVRKLLAQQKQDQKNQQENSQKDQDNQQQDQQNQQADENNQRQDQTKPQEQQSQNKQQNEQPESQQDEQQNSKNQPDQNQQSQKDKQDNNHDDQKQSNSKIDKDDNGKKTSTDSMSPAEREKAQATEQWLRKVPDDPGGLLKNKFEYYYQLNRQRAASGQQPESTRQGEQRW